MPWQPFKAVIDCCYLVFTIHEKSAGRYCRWLDKRLNMYVSQLFTITTAHIIGMLQR